MSVRSDGLGLYAVEHLFFQLQCDVQNERFKLFSYSARTTRLNGRPATLSKGSGSSQAPTFFRSLESAERELESFKHLSGWALGPVSARPQNVSTRKPQEDPFSVISSG
jgi:hypothetical protein